MWSAVWTHGYMEFTEFNFKMLGTQHVYLYITVCTCIYTLWAVYYEGWSDRVLVQSSRLSGAPTAEQSPESQPEWQAVCANLP